MFYVYLKGRKGERSEPGRPHEGHDTVLPAILIITPRSFPKKISAFARGEAKF